jgi:Na+/proline symporter
VTGFLIGGMVWFSIPMFMATTFGLAGRALAMGSGAYNTFWIGSSQANDGLVPAIVIGEVLGSGGAFALLLQLFMAVTSTGSSEVIAVSSVLTYDLYWTYLNPELKDKVKRAQKKWKEALISGDDAILKAGEEAKPGLKVTIKQAVALYDKLEADEWLAPPPKDGKAADLKAKFETVVGARGETIKFHQLNALLVEQSDGANYEGKILVRMSRFFTCIFAIFMAFLSILLNEIGRLSGGCFGLGFVYMAMGVMIGSAVAPVAMSILWDRANGTVCTASAVLGLVFALVTWAIHAVADDPNSELSVCSLGKDYPLLSSNLVAICSSILMSYVGSLIVGPGCKPGHAVTAEVASEDHATQKEGSFNWKVLTEGEVS